ncbi:agmatine deiminase family protein [Allokutzneria oryzae]|uniref:Agmatine/peptidylarginine deiminase n=1 Tax=Allokutzneria oryzae TaxID=1378989 RepID=A0ABV6A985_9PSEU
MDTDDRTGFRVPAEWEPHSACVMAWPWSRRIWGGQLGAVQQEVVEIARAIARFEPVLMIARPRKAARVRRLCGTAVSVLTLEADDVWTRDTAPVFAVDERRETLLGLDFTFNGWGHKTAYWRRDAALAARLCRRLDVPRHRVHLVSEGGAVITDGEGTLIASEECLLNPNRNPSTDRAVVEQVLARAYGASTVIWLPHGWPGDYFTDGHVDAVAAFLAPGRVLLQSTSDTGEWDTNWCARNREALTSAVDARGRRLEIIEISDHADARAAKGAAAVSHVNFYLANGAAVVPIMGQPQDAAALDLLRELLPCREVVGVPSPTLAWGGGGVHCVTQPIPRTTRPLKTEQGQA